MSEVNGSVSVTNQNKRPPQNEEMKGGPLKKRRIEYVSNSSNTNNAYIFSKSDATQQAIPDLIASPNTNTKISEYPIYGSAADRSAENTLLSTIDEYINSIKRSDGKCTIYEKSV